MSFFKNIPAGTMAVETTVEASTTAGTWGRAI